MLSNYQNLITKLDEFIRKYYKNLLLRGLIYSTALVLLFFVSATSLEYFAHFNSAVRTVLFYSFVLATLFILVKYIAIPVSKLYKFGKVISHEDASEIIGKHFLNVQDKLLNVLQLQSLQNTTQEISSNNYQLIEASINQKTAELKPIPFASAVDFTENRKYLKYALVPVLAITVILFAAPSIITDGTKRLVKHSEYFEKEAPFQFVITNSNLKTATQQDYELKVKLTGDEVPDNVYVEIDGNEFKLDKENIVNFNYIFKNVQKSIPFQLVADGFKSKEYELVALPNPILLNFDIAIAYPKYLNKKDEVVKNTGDLIVPSGTKLSWNFNTQNTQQLRLNFNDTSFAVAPTSENNFIYSTRLFRDKSYSVTTANQYLKSKDSVTYSINVIPDGYPQITVAEKKDSTSTKRIYFRGEVKDDYGFNKLTFNYRFINSNDSTSSDKYKKMTTNGVAIAISKTQTQDQFYHYWDMTELGVSPGDQIEYYFEVWDNDGVTGSKSSRSSKMIFKAPTIEELEKNTDKNNDKIKSDLEESLRQAKDVQKELADLQRKVAEKKDLSWEEKKKLKELLEKQKQLQKKIENVKNENQQNNQQKSEYKQPNEEMLEKQRQLEELFDKVMTPELKEKYDELQKLLEKLDKEKVQDALDKMKLENKDLMKELNRNLEIFKQLEVEQKLQENIDKLKDLAQKQDELAKQSEEKKADAKEQKAKQDNLNKKFEDLKKDLKELDKKNSELEEPKKLENTEQKQEEIQKEQEKSSENLNENKKKDAAKSQKDAAKKMEEMSQQMEQAQEKEEAQQDEEDINKLRNLLENIIQLSFGQESLMGELSKTKTNDPQFVKINQKQKKLKDDAKMVEDSLLALSKRQPAIAAAVNKEISAINMNMDKSLEEIAEAQTPSPDGKNHKQEAMSRQQFAMTSINNLALMLNEALSSMQAAAKKPGKPGSGSCKKPGGKGQKPSMATMRQMQEQINQQIKKLKEGMAKGGEKPGTKPGQGQGMGMGGMSKELAQLAAQQAALRQELQKMSDQLNKDGKGAGGMNKIAEKMEETETDLVNKMISQETINRQEEILTRLLESEKAEKEREMDEKRQSNEAKNENFSNPNEFLEYNMLKQKETELLKTVPPSLTPFFKSKVNQYFNNFGN
ncbi:ATPase [soil metagenome]